MPVLKIFEYTTDKEPVVVYSGVTWTYQKKVHKLTLWLEGVQFDYNCEKLENSENGMIFNAYCEIASLEENPQEVTRW